MVKNEFSLSLHHLLLDLWGIQIGESRRREKGAVLAKIFRLKKLKEGKRVVVGLIIVAQPRFPLPQCHLLSSSKLEVSLYELMCFLSSSESTSKFSHDFRDKTSSSLFSTRRRNHLEWQEIMVDHRVVGKVVIRYGWYVIILWNEINLKIVIFFFLHYTQVT